MVKRNGSGGRKDNSHKIDKILENFSHRDSSQSWEDRVEATQERSEEKGFIR